MHDFAPAPFARLTIFLASGTISARVWSFSNQEAFFILFAAYLLVLIFVKGKLFSNRSLLGLLGLLVIFFGGRTLYMKEYVSENPIISCNELLSSNQFLLWISEPLTSKGKYQRGEARVLGFETSDGWKSCDYKINVTAEEDVDLDFEDLIMIDSNPDTIKSSLSGDFDFKEYYATKGVYLTEYITTQKIRACGKKEASLVFEFAYSIRNYVESTLDTYFVESQSKGILKALIIGQKSDLDSEVKENFGNSGTMHVLAVSGLHVGIFYGIFLLVFRNLIDTRWKYAIVTFIVAILWLYAVVTGLSPSVVRAVTMFSILSLGKLINRKNNPFNLVFVSAFVLLLVQPKLLFSVGFQLSYLAVFSILFFAPSMLRSQPVWMPTKVWTLLVVSLSAQIGTLPLTLMYFKQFPTYFLISNLIVIPSIVLILNAGLLLIALANFELLQVWLSNFIDRVIQLLLAIIEILNQLPVSTINTRVFTGVEVLLMYLLIAFLSMFWLKRYFGWLVVSLLVTLSFSASRFLNIMSYY